MLIGEMLTVFHFRLAMLDRVQCLDNVRILMTSVVIGEYTLDGFGISVWSPRARILMLIGRVRQVQDIT